VIIGKTKRKNGLPQQKKNLSYREKGVWSMGRLYILMWLKNYDQLFIPSLIRDILYPYDSRFSIFDGDYYFPDGVYISVHFKDASTNFITDMKRVAMDFYVPVPDKRQNCWSRLSFRGRTLFEPLIVSL
jgi:hypothetical protein